MQSQLSDAREECGLLGMELEEMRVKVERLTEECQERSDQANEWYKALEVQCVGDPFGEGRSHLCEILCHKLPYTHVECSEGAVKSVLQNILHQCTCI